jgi:hypothetical protein
MPASVAAVATKNITPARMLLVSSAFGIRSERRLCAEVHLHLAYHWFDLLPERWTLSTVCCKIGK